MASYKIIGADQKVYGPVSGEQLRQWMLEGRAIGETQIQVSGSEVWQSLATVPEFFPSPPLQPPSHPLPPLLPQHPFQTMAPVGQPSPPRRKNNGYAVTGFILSLVSLPFFWLPLFSLLGIIFSTVGLMQVRHRPWQKGWGLALSGLIVALCSLAFAALLYTMLGVGNLGFPAQRNYY